MADGQSAIDLRGHTEGTLVPTSPLLDALPSERRVMRSPDPRPVPAPQAGRALGSGQLASLLPALDGRDTPYRRLAQAISQLILDGRIALHVKLPSERALARALGASRTLVNYAYNVLKQTGFARSHRGAGTYTCLPQGRTLTSVARTIHTEDAVIDLARASSGLPPKELADALESSARHLVAQSATPGYHPYGLPDLRAMVADQFTERGLATIPEQVLITCGAQHALSLALGVLCSPGDRILVETPTYPNALEALRRQRLHAVTVPVGPHGWDPDIIDAALRQTVPHAAFLIPDFHNPTGLVMPSETRARILHTAQRTGTWLLVDETLADLALDVTPPTSFARHASPVESSRVITIGSMSKSFWAGLRTGWLRAPADLIDELASHRIATDLGGSVVDQILAQHLLGRRGEILPPRLEQLRGQRTDLQAALREQLPSWSWQQPEGGLSLWVDLGRPTASAIAERAGRLGVRIESGSWFSADPGVCETRLRIPYTLSSAALREAVRLLAVADGEEPSRSSHRRPQWIA